MSVSVDNITLYVMNEQWLDFLYGLNTETLLDKVNVLHCLFSVPVLICTYILYGFLFRPINRVRLFGEFGYLPDGRLSKKEIANRVRRQRAVGDIPPVYPNGWFGLMESWQIKVGDTKAVSALVPEVAKVKSWKSMELNGWVYIWHHAEDIEPNWKLPEIEEIANGMWQYKGRTEHFINAHIEEIPENGADVAHLKMVHGPFIAAGEDLLKMWSKYWSWGKHEWQAAWSQMPSPDEHIGKMKVVHDLSLFGVVIPFLKLKVEAQQIGPGVVYLMFESFFSKGVFIHNLLPVEPILQKMVHNIYIHWAVPNIIAKCFMVAEAIHIERDIMIWNNKTYAPKPVFTKSKECSLVSRHRRWYSQFYSEHSPRLKFQKETLDW